VLADLWRKKTGAVSLNLGRDAPPGNLQHDWLMKSNLQESEINERARQKMTKRQKVL
jgi:hypothetical protein